MLTTLMIYLLLNLGYLKNKGGSIRRLRFESETVVIRARVKGFPIRAQDLIL